MPSPVLVNVSAAAGLLLATLYCLLDPGSQLLGPSLLTTTWSQWATFAGQNFEQNKTLLNKIERTLIWVREALKKIQKKYRSDVIHKITNCNPTPFQFYTLLILHPSNLALFQSYTLSILHSSIPTLLQSYTLPILHSSNPTLFQSYTPPSVRPSQTTLRYTGLLRRQ